MEQPGQTPRERLPSGDRSDETSTQAAPAALLSEAAAMLGVSEAASPSGGSNGSHSTGASSHASRIALDQEPTVISKPKPLGASSRPKRPSLSVLEFGRTLEGTTLDHFELREFIGGGGMGAVFRGIDTRLGRVVAVKVLSRDQHDPETRKRFQNEAQNAARLDHDNIARVYYVGEASGWSYIVFEFIEGVNIRDLVEEKGILSLADAISYTIQLAEALTHAASRDVVHRDIKPSNVLITPQGKAKLVDMGLARLHHMQAGEEDLTASGVTLGTFDYISPEQAHDPRSADVRSDLYSLGCTLFYVLTGRPPFPEGTVLQKLISHNSVAPPDIRKLRPELPATIGAIVEKLLVKKPEDRYQTPRDLIDDLVRCAESSGIDLMFLAPVSRPVAPEAPPAWWTAHLPWVAPLVLLALMAVLSDWIFPQREASGTPAPRFNVPNAQGPARPSAVAAVDKKPAPPLPAPPMPMRVPTETPMPGDPTASDPVGPIAVSPSPMPAVVPSDPAGGTANELPGPAEVEVTPVTPVAPAPGPGEARPVVPPVAPAQPAERLIVVGLVAKEEAATPAADLASAVALAAREFAGQPVTIELRYDGLRRSPPLRLVNQKLTIRGGDGFSPTVLFAPDEGKMTRVPPAMVSIIGGSFELRDLAVIFAVPQQPSETWALFEIQQASKFYVWNSSLTIENAYGGRLASHSDVAFFDLLPPPESQPLMKPEEMMAQAEVSVPLELWHVVARGEATLVRARESIPFTFDWENGLLATSERMFALGGAPSASQLGGQIEIKLSHITAAMDKGLLALQAGGSTRHLLGLKAKLANCIFLAGDGMPLIEERGYEDAEMLKKKFHISAGSISNLYQGGFQRPLELFWRITSMGTKPETVELDFDGWSKQSAEMMPQRRLVKWIAPPAAELAPHKHTKRDYQLRPERTNPARGAADDGTDAGFASDQLPDPPEGRPASADSAPAPLPPAPTGMRPVASPR